MGNLFSNILGPPEKRKVLVLGLSGAGKTKVLEHIGPVHENMLTVGFAVSQIKQIHERIEFEYVSWAVDGGGGRIRILWRHYYEATDAIIFVVDSADQVSMEEAKKQLRLLAEEPLLQSTGIVILANKQDLPGAKDLSQIEKDLQLEKLNQPWTVIASCALTGEGLYSGLDWITLHTPS